MRDKRPVDELSIEELERILAIRKREERLKRLRRYDDRGRRLPVTLADDAPPAPEPAPPPQQHEAAATLPPPEPPVTYDLTDELPRFEGEDDEDLVLPILPRRQEPAPAPASDGKGRSRVRGAWDKLLLAIEVVGVVGIVLILAYGGYLIATENRRIEALDQKSAEIQQEAAALRATATPRPELTIDLAQYVLPGGHYSPADTSRAGQFNLDELPASIRPAAASQLVAPRAAPPTPQPTSPTRIVIPAIGVDAAIYGGDDWYALQKGVGHYLNSANPGENGNMVLTAHNDVYGEIFRYLENLEVGDEVRVQADNGKWYTYVVSETHIVNPSDTWVLAHQNRPTVTLITCHPYRVDTQRYVVFADLVGESF
jgi:sortase A